MMIKKRKKKMSNKNRFEEVKVRNFYYLLAYAFNDEKIYFEDNEKFGSEAMENIYDLFSIVLYIRLKKILLKKFWRLKQMMTLRALHKKM